VASFTPRPLYPRGKSPWYPSDRRLGRDEEGRIFLKFEMKKVENLYSEFESNVLVTFIH
jgi:hypothetical protein